MKLHLPTGLKAALLATFTVLAASWSHQGYAAELTKVITMSQMAQEATITDGATLSTTWEMTDGVVYDFSGSGYLGGIANTDLLNALKGDDYVTVAAWINPSSHAAGTGGGDGGSLFGYGAQGDGIKVIDRNGALKATTKNVADFTTSAVGIDLNTWQLVAVTMHRNNGKLDVYYMLDGVYSSVVTGGAPNAASTDSFAIGSGNSESPRELYQGSIGNMIVFTSTEMVTVTDVTSQMGTAPTKIPGLDLTWNGSGTTAAWDLTSTNWLKSGSPSTFETGPGITVTFGTGAVAKTVTINETIDAGEVVVGDNYTFTMGDDATLMMNSLSLDAGKTLALGGTGTMMAGGLTYGSGSALNITGNIAMRATALTSGTTSSLHVLSGGVLTIGTDATVDGQGFVGTDGSSEQGGTQAFSKLFRGEVVDVQTGGKLVMDGNMNFNDSSVSGVGHQTSGVADMEITGSVQINTYGNGNTWALGKNKLKVGGDLWLTNKQYLDIAGGSTEVVGTLALAHAQNGAGGNYRATVTAAEGSTLTLRDIKFYGGRNEVNVDGSTLTFTQESGLLVQDGTVPTAAADFNTVNFNNATLVAQANSWELAPLDSATVNTSGTATLDVGEGQGMTLTFTNVDGSFSKKGAGTATVSGTGYLNDTIVVKQGELVLGGTYGIDNNSSGMDVSYSGAEHAGNGFRTTKGNITVYTTEGTAVFSGDAEFTYAGETVTLTNGKYLAPEKTDNTTFYVNTDAESVSKATARPEMQHIVLAGNTTLNVDQDVAGSVVSVASGTATVNILADKTVNGTMLGVTLTGAGTYALTEGTAVLGTGVMLGEGWTGAVRIGGFASGNDTHLNDLVNGDKSILEINGITGGHLPEWIDGTITANIRLTDKGDTAAWTWTNGTTGTTPVNLTFSGKWSGEGSFVKTGNYNQSFTFAGDIKDWVGSFVYASGNYTTNLTLKDNANEVNAFIEKTGNGTLNILVETDVTFNAAIDASKLDVSSGKTATLNTDENYTISGGLSGTGSLVKTGTGTVTIASPTGTGTSAAMLDITVSEGALEATAANALGSGPITVAAGATLKLANGGALGTSQAVTNNGNVTLGSTLTAGSITGGTLTLTPEFPVDSELKDVGDITDTGNGFSLGGVIHVYDTEHAMLTGITDIIHGDKHYSLATDVDENGDINASTPDWTTYQLKVDNDSQPTIQAIMDYADTQSGGTGTLQHIVVTGVGLSLVDDSTAFKTSMLGGDKLNSLRLVLVNGASLKMDADLATSLQFGSNSGDAAAEIVLEKNAAIDGAIWAYTAAGGVADLTVKGAYTLSLSELDLTHGKVTLQDGAKVAVVTIDPEGGDSIVVKDTAELSLANGSISIKAVDTAKDATLSTETGATYDIGSEDYTIENARITLSYSDAAHNFGHTVAGDVALVNAGTSSVRDTNAANTAYDELYAQNGDIYLSNKSSVTVRDLTLDNGRSVGVMPGDNVALTVTGTAAFGSGSKLGTALTMAANSTLDTANPVALQNHALSLEKGVVIGDDLWSSLKTLTPLSTTTLFTGVSDLTLAGSVFSNPVDLTTVFTNAELKPKKYTLSFAGGNVVITKEMENNRYWKSGNGPWNNTSVVWTDEDGSGTDVKFESGYNAHFTVNGGGGTITVEEAVNVASVNVSGAKYNFTNAEMLNITNGIDVSESGSATFSKLADKELGTIGIGSGSTMLVTEGNVAVQTFSNEGDLTVSGGSLTVKNATAKGGNVEVTNLTLAGENTFGTVKVSGTVSGATSIKVGGTSRITTLSGVNTLTLTDGTLTLGTTSGLNATTLSGALTAGPGVDLGSVTMNDGSSIKGNGAVTASGVSVTGAADILGGTLQTASVGGTGTLKIASGSTVGGSNLSVADKATLELLEGSTLDNSGTLSVVGKVIAGNGINLGEVAATGTVEVNGASVSATGGSIATLDIGAGETLAVAGDLALTGTAGTAGVLTVGGGLTVNGAVTLTDVTAGTLELANSGTLTATGTLDAGSITLRRVSKTEAYLTAGTLSDTTTDFVVDKQLIWDLGAQTGQVITLAYVDSAYVGAENLTINGVKSISDKNRHSYTIMQDATSHDIILKVEDQESGFVWTGNEDTLWSHAGNWSNLTVPGEEDWVQVKGDTHTIELDGNPSVAYFTVSAQSATLQGEHTLAVGSELEVNMNATLYVGDASTPTAIVAPTATINGTLVVQPGSSVQADATTITGGTLNVNDASYTAETIDMTEGALRTSPDAYVVTGQLNGDIDSIVGGHVIIASTGSRFIGGYDDAYIDIAEDAEAVLYAGEGLTLGGNGTAKLRYSGSTAIDGIDADELTIVLNNPNTSLIGSTLTLQDESALTNGTLEFGMSAIESAKSIGSALAPQVIEGSLVLGDGTTVVVNQDALADSGIAMAVYNGNARRNLALAYIGNGETDTKSVLLNGYLYGKYYKNARIEDGKLLVDMRDDFYQDLTKANTENGVAGAGMLDDALVYVNPQVTNPDGDLAAVMTALETGAIPQGSADRVTAAMSGASHAAMGAAWSHDVDRQLRAIRNRTTQMGMADCVVNEDLPYFNAWINAEGGYGKMNADSTLAGYKLSSWGGTLGVDVDLTPRFTFGAAVTAMSGDFTADSAETAEGDLDRMYVTVFGRYSRRAWSHTLVATYGMADTNLKRTVNYGNGSYTAESDSDGSAFGVMYEAGYAAALNEDASTCLQPVLNLSYRHSSLDGSREKGRSDAALKLGDAEANVFTVALGARLQSTVGTSVYNRATLFEGRVLCKVDTGDRDVAAANSFTGVGRGRDAKSSEMGLFGLEIGAGLTIPVAERGGAVFLDVTGEFRAKYTEVNGTVGYRFNF